MYYSMMLHEERVSNDRHRKRPRSGVTTFGHGAATTAAVVHHSSSPLPSPRRRRNVLWCYVPILWLGMISPTSAGYCDAAVGWCKSPSSLSSSSSSLSSFRSTNHPLYTNYGRRCIPWNDGHSVRSLAFASLPSSSSSSHHHQQPSSNDNVGRPTTATAVVTKPHHIKMKKGATRKDQICTLFRQAKTYEKMGQWSFAIQNYEYIIQTLNQQDAHSYLALAKLQTKRQQYTTAQQLYQTGMLACPTSIHLVQAYAIYEETIAQNITRAKELYEHALTIDSYNPYVCHAYSGLERKMGNVTHAIALLQRALEHGNTTTAAVVCTLGELYIALGQYDQTRQLYQENIPRIQLHHHNHQQQHHSKNIRTTTTTKDHHSHSGEIAAVREQQVEIYLAYAWLEERYYHNYHGARELLLTAYDKCPTSPVIQIALARFEGRRPVVDPAANTMTTTTTLSATPRIRSMSHNNNATMMTTTTLEHRQSKDTRHNASVRRLASACMKLEQQQQQQQQPNDVGGGNTVTSKSSLRPKHHGSDVPTDGRIYNAWANIEVKAKRLSEARKILYRGLIQFPQDHTLLQATGKVEERLGNWSGAQYYYGESLRIQPSAPTLVAFALLNLKNYHHDDDDDGKVPPSSIQPHDTDLTKFNVNETKRLFEEALMIDRRHGPAYNAYARTVMEYEQNVDLARHIYERGIHANCTDMASIYHGYARLELSLGHVEKARDILIEGQEAVNRIHIGTDSPHRDRAVFLTHTLGMLELNHHRPVHAYDVFMDGIDRYGNSSQLLLGAALSLLKLGKERQARDYFEQAVTSDERHAQAWQAWGMMEMRDGNYKTAKVILECGIRSTPRYGPLWHAYGLLESRTGNMEMARKLFEKGIDVAPNHVGLYQSWATLELREENYSVAKALIAEALTRDKHNGVGWLIAADIEQQMGHYGLSLLVLRRGIECSESSNNNNSKVRLYRALGDTLVRLGKIVEARQVLEQGITIDPMYAPLYHSLAELEARVGNVEELARLNKRTASIFSTTASLQQAYRSSDALTRSAMINSRPVLLQNNQSTDVSHTVAALAKRIVPDDEEVGNVGRSRQPNESSIFLDNLMNSFCLDDDCLYFV